MSATKLSKNVNYFPPSPEPEVTEECTVVKYKGDDPVHLPTPESSPSKDPPDDERDTTEARSEASIQSTEVKIRCSCRLEDRGTPSPKPTSAKIAKDSTTTTPTPSALDALKSPSTSTTTSRRRGRRGRKKAVTPVAQKDAAPTEKQSTNKSKKTRAKTKPKQESKAEEEMHQKVLTDYFPVRRSSRTPSNLLKKQQEEDLKAAILGKSEEGLKIIDIEGKGRGIVATKDFQRGDFVVEYAGDLINLKVAKTREEKYKQNSSIGCYMYYFNFNSKSYCVDATAESGRLGRLLNHSRNGNCTTKVIGIDDRPYLLLVADQDISAGDELLYDYGDRNKESLEAHPWLAL